MAAATLPDTASAAEARNPGRELSRFIEAKAPGRSLWNDLGFDHDVDRLLQEG